MRNSGGRIKFASRTRSLGLSSAFKQIRVARFIGGSNTRKHFQFCGKFLWRTCFLPRKGRKSRLRSSPLLVSVRRAWNVPVGISRPSSCCKTVFPFILAFPKWFPLLMYCSRCGTFGNERHLPTFDKCSSRFREPAGLPCVSVGTTKNHGGQRRRATGKSKVLRLMKRLILLVAHVAELADALDSGSSE